MLLVRQCCAILILHLCRIVVTFANDTNGGRAYARYSNCRPHLPEDDSDIRGVFKYGVPPNNINRPKGYLGRVGILAGSDNQARSAYFAAITALRVGADEVGIFCTRKAAPAIAVHLKDVSYHPIVDVDLAKTGRLLVEMDVVLIGPGLIYDTATLNAVNYVIGQAKAHKKPLVLDLIKPFWTQAMINSLKDYPKPGLILALNSDEFEAYYALVKSSEGFSEAHISVDFEKKVGANTLIYRKGCTDTAFTRDPRSGWSLSEGGSTRRTAGQGDAISGAVAVYFHWAIENLSPELVGRFGDMLPASSAAHSAAKLMRACNRLAYAQYGKSALTSDMVKRVVGQLYGVA